jgi:hypothetical protein
MDPSALVSPAITVGLCAASGITAWIVRATRTSDEARSIKTNLARVETTHDKRLDGHDEEIKLIKSDFVPRRELSEKLELYLAPMQKQMDQQTRLLEFAVLNKRPEIPGVMVDQR